MAVLNSESLSKLSTRRATALCSYSPIRKLFSVSHKSTSFISTVAAPPAERGSSHCPDSCWDDETGGRDLKYKAEVSLRREPRASLGM